MNFSAKFFSELSGAEVYEILKSRSAVFVVEQKINCLDADGVDYDALHCMLTDESGNVLGYLRAYYIEDGSVKIGRVLSLNHGQGIGRLVMEEGLKIISEKLPSKRQVLHSQSYAKDFYEKFGFTVCSDEFIEEEILHVEMERYPEK